jgi:hypothetical protein
MPSIEDWPDYQPPSSEGGDMQVVGGRPTITIRPRSAYKSVEDWENYDASKVPPPARQIGATEAFTRGALDSASFGLMPVLTGLQAAGNAPGATVQQKGIADAMAGVPSEAPGLEQSGLGLARHDEAARRAYEETRARESEARSAGFEQHPFASVGGELAGGLLTPGFGVGTPGTLGARLATGALAGAVGGGIYGGGSAIGEGGGAQEALRGAATGAALGGPFGAALGGAFGPRIANPALERAAQTARALGPGAPRGLMSAVPGVPQLTSSLASVPLAGHKIIGNVQKLQEAAGEKIGDIASSLTPPSRAVADDAVRRGLESAIAANKQQASAHYNAVDALMHPSTPIDLTQTRSAVQSVIDRRVGKRQPDPEAGLQQVLNAIRHPEPISMEGARGLRSDVRDAGDLSPHPGLNAGDYNRIAQAITGDMRFAAHQHGAGPEFETAEKRFSEIAARNTVLNKIRRSSGEAAISKLTGAAREKGGDVRLLQGLQKTMPAAEFQQIGGSILHELGSAPATGHFSLDRFVTGWNKLSGDAKQALFSASHLKNIDDIVHLGQHLKSALSTTNKSHTAQALILWEVARDALEGAIALSAGVINPWYGAYTVGSAVGLNLFTRWLALPSKSASMGVWSRVLQGVMQDATPTRQAIFAASTRNLAHRLGVPVESIFHATERATTADQEQNNTVTLHPVEGNPHTVTLHPVEHNPFLRHRETDQT